MAVLKIDLKITDMRKLSFGLTLFFGWISGIAIGQEIELFSLSAMEYNENEKVFLVSLSEIYPLSEHPDSSAIPDIGDWEMLDANTIVLDSIYRQRFFARTGLLLTERLIVYDYLNNISASFPLNTLRLVACLNMYAGNDDWPYSQYEYMIGFELEPSVLANFNPFFYQTFVYLGSSDPFAHQPLKPIHWSLVDKLNLPKSKMMKAQKTFLKNHTCGNKYVFEENGFKYMIQEYLFEANLNARRMVIEDIKTKKIVCERFFRDSEGASLAPLNYTDLENILQIDQWTGVLFKDKPPVVFGFLYQSFGCPAITFLNATMEDVYIRCDNRH